MLQPREATEDPIYSRSLLLAHLDYQRKRTLGVVSGLTVAQLDYRFLPQANSIGMILRHVACLWSKIGAKVFENRGYTNEEMRHWAGAVGGLPLQPREGNDLQFYLGLLEQEYRVFCGKLADQTDVWINEPSPLIPQFKSRYYCLFHICEDECSHVGQIKLIKGIYKRAVAAPEPKS